jgi:hypothetical protein
MSRSALEKSMIRQMQKLQQQQQESTVAAVDPSMQYGVPYGMPPYPGAISVAPVAPQPFVPIRLTGDEDDIDHPDNKTNAVPMHGNLSTFNMNNLLHNNIMGSEYFRALYQLKTYHEVIDEIYRSVSIPK